MSASITTFPALRRPRRRLSAPVQGTWLRPVPAPVAETPIGRAWINGREIGGPPPGTAHLGISHD